MTTVFLTHSKIRLALHELRVDAGRPLLLLHPLGESAPSSVPDELAGWKGPVWALDFTGHGASTVPRGGGYTAEFLMGDADAALEHLESATLVGFGLGAYIALLTAGTRPHSVRGAVLCDGAGLAGGGPTPGPAALRLPEVTGDGPPDPFALVELAADLRPPDYARLFARQARSLSGLDRPISVCASERPEWLRAILEDPGVGTASLEQVLALYDEAAAMPR